MGDTYIDQLAEAIRDEVDPSRLPSEETTVLFRLYAVLALSKGDAVTREDVHNAWAAWMAGKDSCHQSLKPYHELPVEVQLQDQPYVDAIHVVAARRASMRSSANRA